MPDEEAQERGREGVGMIKTWLEATTWMEFQFNAYEDGNRCAVPLLVGRKKFDLRGHHLGDKHQRRILSVECKRYTTKGAQRKDFRRFLAIAYSAHAKQMELLGGDWAEDFIWVTSNPFETDNWSKLRSEEYMLDVLTDPAHQDVLGDEHVINEALARKVVSATWLLVFDEKQMDVALTGEELRSVMTVLNREGPSLWPH